MDLSLVYLLLGPQLWWVWETLIIVAYVMKKVFAPMNSVFIIRIQDKGANAPEVVATRWVKKWKTNYRWRKGESHTLNAAGDIAASPFSWPSFMGPAPALLQFDKSTRPAQVTIADPEHNVKKKAYNPSSQAFDDFMEEEAYEQGERANKVNKPEIGLLILAAVAAFAGGVIVGPYLSIHQAAAGVIMVLFR